MFFLKNIRFEKKSWISVYANSDPSLIYHYWTITIYSIYSIYLSKDNKYATIGIQQFWHVRQQTAIDNYSHNVAIL